MSHWRVFLNGAILFCLIFLIACRFDPFGRNWDNGSEDGLPVGLTPEEIQSIIDDIQAQQAVLPVSLEAPAYSFYRFDYTNAAGGHRMATILSYDQAIATPAYGVETTARVLIYEAMKARTGYPFDFFTFSNGLSQERIEPVITSIAAMFSDADFLLKSSEPIGSATLVVKAVDEVVSGLPLPPAAEFTPVPIAAPAVNLDLRPDFSSLPTTTLASLLVNQDLQSMYASMTTTGLANYSLFKSSVPVVSQPRTAIRAHDNNTGNHSVTNNYGVSLAPISGIGTVTRTVTVLPQVASSQVVVTPSGSDQKIVFTYGGDRAIAPVFKGTIKKLHVNFRYRDYYDNCHKSDTEGPITTLTGWEIAAVGIDKTSPSTTAPELLCSIIVDNQAIATFTARRGEPATVVLPIPADRVSTLSCYLVPPQDAPAVEASIRASLQGDLTAGERAFRAEEVEAWNSALKASAEVQLADSSRKIYVPRLFQTWFRPQGPYEYQNDLTEFTPEVFRGLAAPAAPAVVLDMSGCTAEPLYAFSLPFSLQPLLKGIATGSFQTAQTFSIAGGGSYAYSLDDGATWLEYSGPVTLTAEGFYRVRARNNFTNLISPVIPLKIDRTPPAPPVVTGLSAGVFNQPQTFTISGEPGATLMYYLFPWNSNVPAIARYSEPVTIGALKKSVFVALQIDSAGNRGAQTSPITLEIIQTDFTAPLAPTIIGIASGTFSGDQTFTVSGAESGGTLYYSLDGGETTATYSAAVTLTENLRTYDIVAWQRDAFGNVGTRTAVITVTIDKNAPPIPTIAGIAPGFFSENQTFTVSGAEPGGTLYYSLDGGTTPAVYSAAVTLVENAQSYQIVAWQQDASGNESSRTATITVTIDKTAPAAPTIAGITAGSFTENQTFTVSGAEPGGSLYYSLDGGTTPATYTGAVTLSENLREYRIVAWQRDAAGNVGAKTAAVAVTLLGLPPTVTAVSPASGDNTGVLTGVQITGTGFLAGSVPKLTQAGQTVVTGTSVTFASSTSLTGSFDLTGLAAGLWNVEVVNPDGRTATGANLFTVRSKTWTKSFGGTGNEAAMYCVNAGDGGFIVAGTTPSDNGHVTGFKGGDNDVWVAKVDEYGGLVWSKCIGGGGSDRCSGLIAISGGYVFSGDTTSSDGDLAGVNQTKTTDQSVTARSGSVQAAWICRLDLSGNIVTQGLYAMNPAQPSDARGGVKTTSDGGYILAGTTFDGSYNYGWGVKLNASLVQQWECRLAANSGQAYALGVAQKSGGNILLCGYTQWGAGDFSGKGYSASDDGFVFELASADGSVVSGKCFGGTGADYCSSVVPLSDGGFYVVGSTGSSDGICPATRGSSDLMLLKVNSDYSVAWAKNLGGANAELGVQGELAADGGLLFAGNTASTDGDVVGNHAATSDFWLGKMSSAGSLEWQKCFGGTADDYAAKFMVTSDGGFILGGYGTSDNGDFVGIGDQIVNSDFILIRGLSLPTP